MSILNISKITGETILQRRTNFYREFLFPIAFNPKVSPDSG